MSGTPSKRRKSVTTPGTNRRVRAQSRVNEEPEQPKAEVDVEQTSQVSSSLSSPPPARNEMHWTRYFKIDVPPSVGLVSDSTPSTPKRGAFSATSFADSTVEPSHHEYLRWGILALLMYTILSVVQVSLSPVYFDAFCRRPLPWMNPSCWPGLIAPLFGSVPIRSTSVISAEIGATANDIQSLLSKESVDGAELVRATKSVLLRVLNAEESIWKQHEEFRVEMSSYADRFAILSKQAGALSDIESQLSLVQQKLEDTFSLSQSTSGSLKSVESRLLLSDSINNDQSIRLDSYMQKLTDHDNSLLRIDSTLTDSISRISTLEAETSSIKSLHDSFVNNEEFNDFVTKTELTLKHHSIHFPSATEQVARDLETVADNLDYGLNTVLERAELAVKNSADKTLESAINLIAQSEKRYIDRLTEAEIRAHNLDARFTRELDNIQRSVSSSSKFADIASIAAAETKILFNTTKISVESVMSKLNDFDFNAAVVGSSPSDRVPTTLPIDPKLVDELNLSIQSVRDTLENTVSDVVDLKSKFTLTTETLTKVSAATDSFAETAKSHESLFVEELKKVYSKLNSLEKEVENSIQNNSAVISQDDVRLILDKIEGFQSGLLNVSNILQQMTGLPSDFQKLAESLNELSMNPVLSLSAAGVSSLSKYIEDIQTPSPTRFSTVNTRFTTPSGVTDGTIRRAVLTSGFDGSLDRPASINDLISFADLTLAASYGVQLPGSPNIDFASAAAGAVYIPTLTSPSTTHKGRSMTPYAALSDDVTLGNCWAFPGSSGKLGVKLSQPSSVSAVALEFSPEAVVLGGSSVPRKFRVLGLRDENEEGAKELGHFELDIKGPPKQVFFLPNDTSVYPVVVLDVQSNWGNSQYTCVYRFSVYDK